jgi:hypothetical protein
MIYVYEIYKPYANPKAFGNIHIFFHRIKEKGSAKYVMPLIGGYSDK